MSREAVGKHLEALQRDLRQRAWDPTRVERAFDELSARLGADDVFRRRRQVIRIGGVVLACAALLALTLTSISFFASRREAPARATAPETPGFERIALGDGSEVRYEPGARLDVREQSDTRIVVSVGTGKASFRVRHDPKRTFRVEAGDVHVEDLGTTFDVEHREGSVRVAVSEGSVRVSFEEAGTRRTVTLTAGETGNYRSAVKPAGPPPNGAVEASSAPVPSAEPPGGAADTAGGGDWRELARAGKHRRAYELLAAGGFRDVRNDAGELLLAADVARFSRHPGESVVLLRKVLAAHERDSRAPAAAFTLGWVLMNDLGRPREAARAFARAEALAPSGNLAEDAVARAVEAWYRAGELAQAKSEVERYRARYPGGRHQAMLQRLVGTP